MEIKKYTTKYGEYMFVNESAWCKSGFKHVSTLFKNDTKIGSAEVHYQNRTWESFKFQTSMSKIINQLTEDRKSYLYDKFKAEKGYANISEKRRAEFQKYANEDEKIKEYDLLYYEVNAKY